MEIKVNVTQITHGKEYEGAMVGPSNEIIKCKLLFGVPIDQLDDQKMSDNKQKRMAFARRLFNFTIVKGTKSLDITDELFGFMVGTIGQKAIQFYNDPQTKRYNEEAGIISDAIRNENGNIMKMFGASVSIGFSLSYDIPEKHVPDILK